MQVTVYEMLEHIVIKRPIFIVLQFVCFFICILMSFYGMELDLV